MKCVLGEGITLDVVRDDLSCEDIIEQTLSVARREVGFCWSKILLFWTSCFSNSNRFPFKDLRLFCCSKQYSGSDMNTMQQGPRPIPLQRGPGTWKVQGSTMNITERWNMPKFSQHCINQSFINDSKNLTVVWMKAHAKYSQEWQEFLKFINERGQHSRTKWAGQWYKNLSPFNSLVVSVACLAWSICLNCTSWFLPKITPLYLPCFLTGLGLLIILWLL